MEKQRTFVDNWVESKEEIFKLLITDEIEKAFDNPPEQTPIYSKKISETEFLYLIEDQPILKVKYEPEKSIHTIYVKSKRQDNEYARRNKNKSSRLTLPTARSK